MVRLRGFMPAAISHREQPCLIILILTHLSTAPVPAAYIVCCTAQRRTTATLNDGINPVKGHIDQAHAHTEYSHSDRTNAMKTHRAPMETCRNYGHPSCSP